MIHERPIWPGLSQKRGAAVDRRVRRALVASLKNVYARAANKIEFDEHLLQILLDKIESGPVRPAVFGLYTDLVESLLSQDTGKLHICSQRLLDLDSAGDDTRILALTDEDLGIGQAERYARLVDDDPDRRYAIRPLDTQFREAHSRVSSALRLLDDGVPELAQEIRAIVREIVLVRDAGENEDRTFDGASTFYLWGAVLLNVGDATRLDLAQQIAHEAAHLMLFGLMIGKPLTENTLDERYTSPLRQDPRPMEGVVHATYVLARMSYALERLMDAGMLFDEEQEKARQDLTIHRDGFVDTIPIILQHAKFRPEGEVAFRCAIDYMMRGDDRKQAIA